MQSGTFLTRLDQTITGKDTSKKVQFNTQKQRRKSKSKNRENSSSATKKDDEVVERTIQFTYNERKHTLYLDREITQEARRVLGFDKNCFKKKKREQFQERDVEPQIIELRYKHYCERYNGMLMKIKDQTRFLRKNDHRFRQSSKKRRMSLQANNYNYRASLTDMQSTRNKNSLRKVFQYLRTEDPGPSDIDTNNLVPFADSELDDELFHKLNKFNKTKAQRQRIALLKYQFETARLVKLEEFNLKNKKIERFFRRQQQERDKRKSKKAKEYKQKLRNAKGQQHQRRLQFIRTQEGLKTRIMEKEKRKEQEGQAMRVTRDHYIESTRVRQRSNYAKKQELNKQQFKANLDLFDRINDKTNQYSYVRECILKKTSGDCHIHNIKVEENVYENKKIIVQSQFDLKQSTIKKLDQEFHKIKRFQRSKVRDARKKQKESRKAEEKLAGRKERVDMIWRKRRKEEYEARLRKQKGCVQFKQQKQMERKLLREIEKLKNVESKENLKQTVRQQEYKVKLIKQKQREINEFEAFKKEEKSLIIDAQMEIQIQLKKELDRINAAVTDATTRLSMKQFLNMKDNYNKRKYDNEKKTAKKLLSSIFSTSKYEKDFYKPKPSKNNKNKSMQM